MSYNSSNIVPPAQQALNNQRSATLPGLSGGMSYSAYKAPVNSAANAMSVYTGQPVYKAPTPAPTYAPQYNSAANATSTITKQPVYVAPSPAPPYSGGAASGTSTALPQAPSAPLAGALTQAQLDAQNASRGISQFNTGPAQVGGAVGSQDQQNGQTGGSTGSGSMGATFPGLVSGMLGNAQNYAQQQAALTQKAQDVASQFGTQEAAITGQFNGTNSDESGRMAQLEQIKQGTLGAINQQQAALAGYQTPITQAYQTGIGAAHPQLGNYGQTYYDPLNPNSSGGGNLDPQTQAGSLAQKVMDKSMTYEQALSSMGYAGSAGTTFLNNAITKAGGNPLTLQAEGSAQQSNITTGGTAATQAAATGLQQSTQAYVAANTAYTQAQNQSDNLLQTMGATGINTNPQYVNEKINQLQNQFGSTNYAAFITALSEAQQSYTNLLSSVGAATPTVNGQQATAILNQNSTPAQIKSAIDALNAAAYAKLQPMYTQIGTYASQLNQGGGSSGGTSSSGSGFGWNG